MPNQINQIQKSNLNNQIQKQPPNHQPPTTTHHNPNHQIPNIQTKPPTATKLKARQITSKIKQKTTQPSNRNHTNQQHYYPNKHSTNTTTHKITIINKTPNQPTGLAQTVRNTQH